MYLMMCCVFVLILIVIDMFGESSKVCLFVVKVFCFRMILLV